MAINNSIVNRVKELSGSSNTSMIQDYISMGCKYVVATVPKNKLFGFTTDVSWADVSTSVSSWASNTGYMQATVGSSAQFSVGDHAVVSGSTSADGVYIVIAIADSTHLTIDKDYVAQAAAGDSIFKLRDFDSDSIVSVRRNGYSASKVMSDVKNFVLDSNSLRKATNLYPAYYIEGKSVVIAPLCTQDVGRVQYIDAPESTGSETTIMGDYDNIIVWYAASLDCGAQSIDSILTWDDIAAPVLPSTPDFGNNLDITTSPPVAPVIDDITISLPASVPTFTTPVLSIATFSETFPTYTPAVMGGLDYSGVDTSLADEDIELVASKVNKINVQINEFSNLQRDKVQIFSSEQADYQRKFQDFQHEVSNNFKEWTQQVTIQQQKFNEENVEYQASLQAATNDANKAGEKQSKLLQSFGQEISIFQHKTANQVKEFESRISKLNAEWAVDIAKFQADVQKYTAEVATQNNKISSSARDAASYAALSGKYYGWAQSELQSLVGGQQQPAAAAGGGQ